MKAEAIQYRIGVEYEAMNPPKPVCVGVFAGNTAVAYLSIDDVRYVVRRWDEMEAARAADPKSAAGNPSSV
jgi:hypothetical protein